MVNLQMMELQVIFIFSYMSFKIFLYFHDSQPRDWTLVSYTVGRFFTAEPPGKPNFYHKNILIIKKKTTSLKVTEGWRIQSFLVLKQSWISLLVIYNSGNELQLYKYTWTCVIAFMQSNWINHTWNGSPLQYSCLENPMNRGAWQATVHGVGRVGHDLATKPPFTQQECRKERKWKWQSNL